MSAPETLIEVHISLWNVRAVVHGEVRYRPTKGYEVIGHQAPIRDDLLRRRRWSVGLFHEILPTATNGNSQSNQIWDPLPSLPYMYHFVTEEGSYKSNSTCDDDTNVDAQIGILTQSGNCLTADNGTDQTETRYRGRVQKNGNSN